MQNKLLSSVLKDFLKCKMKMNWSHVGARGISLVHWSISVLLPVALRAILYRQGSCDGQVAVV